MQLSFGFFEEKLNVLVIGSGGREHALCWKLKQSPTVGHIFCAPGNGGISLVAEAVPIAADDIIGLAKFAVDQKIGLTVVGPERPLTLGIVDHFSEQGLKIFGPTKQAAQLEASKVFAKQFMQRHGIPTAGFEVFGSYEDALSFVEDGVFDFPFVIKADGLAAGKGVIIVRNNQEAQNALQLIMKDKVFGDAGNCVVVEEFLVGEEASFMIFADGEDFQALPTSRDHKQVHDGDKGPNTGGMGAYCTDDIVNKSTRKLILDRIVKPTLEGMGEEGNPYKGILYVGLMLTAAGPKVLEFNVRLGDPEAQAVLPRLESGLISVMEATVDGTLDRADIEWSSKVTTCVVLASGGYPGDYEKDKLITGLEMAEEAKDIYLFHSGTRREGEKFYTAGGRVLSITGSGNDLSDAVIKAYEAVNKIHFDGMHYRRDIGAKGLARFKVF